jgi:hypothetical protein
LRAFNPQKPWSIIQDFLVVNPKPITIQITIIKPPSHSHNIIINQIKTTITTLSKQQQQPAVV